MFQRLHSTTFPVKHNGSVLGFVSNNSKFSKNSAEKQQEALSMSIRVRKRITGRSVEKQARELRSTFHNVASLLFILRMRHGSGFVSLESQRFSLINHKGGGAVFCSHRLATVCSPPADSLVGTYLAEGAVHKCRPLCSSREGCSRCSPSEVPLSGRRCRWVGRRASREPRTRTDP